MNDPKSMEDMDIEQVGDAGPDLDTVRGALTNGKAGAWLDDDTAGGTSVPAETEGGEDTEGKSEKLLDDTPRSDLATGETDETGETKTLSSETETAEIETEAVEGDEVAEEVETFTAKRGESEYKVPKDAEFEITIDGKKEKLPLEKILAEASGKIHVGREFGRLGHEKKKFETQRSDFQRKSQQVQENAEMLMQMENPFEFCAYWGMLKQQDPTQVWQELMGRTAQWVEQFQNMSEMEQRLAFENNTFKFREKVAQKQHQVRSTHQQQQHKQQQIHEALKSEGISGEDFQATVQELQELDQQGQFPTQLLNEDGSLNEMAVINFTVAKKFDNRVSSLMDRVNTKLKTDSEFKTKISQAILKTEALSGEAMTDAEVIQLVKLAREKTSKRLSESLSKKADAAKSKPAPSGRQKGKVAATLAEYREQKYPDVWE